MQPLVEQQLNRALVTCGAPIEEINVGDLVLSRSEFDPHGAPPRPPARTTEDYLREREARERTRKPDA